MDKVFRSISDSDLFRETPKEFESASDDVRACKNEASLQYSANRVLDDAMYQMVFAVADYHCARVLFDTLGALNTVHQQEDTTAA